MSGSLLFLLNTWRERTLRYAEVFQENDLKGKNKWQRTWPLGQVRIKEGGSAVKAN